MSETNYSNFDGVERNKSDIKDNNNSNVLDNIINLSKDIIQNKVEPVMNNIENSICEINNFSIILNNLDEQKKQMEKDYYKSFCGCNCCYCCGLKSDCKNQESVKNQIKDIQDKEKEYIVELEKIRDKYMKGHKNEDIKFMNILSKKNKLYDIYKLFPFFSYC